jgi:Domain of unknown function (DUF5615)
VKVLLDENFPLALLRSLQADGMETEHIITLGWRGATDDTIRERLIDADVVFLTQDDDFLFSPPTGSTVVVSRVRQARRIADRVETWRRALRQLPTAPTQGRRFELLDDGTLLPWEQAADGVWISTRRPL